MGKALKSLSKPTGVNRVPFTQLTTFLEILFEDHGLKGNEIPVLWRDGAGRDEESKIEIERGLRGLTRGGEVSVCPSLENSSRKGIGLMSRIHILLDSYPD